jgi:hypothetical protein
MAGTLAKIEGCEMDTIAIEDNCCAGHLIGEVGYRGDVVKSGLGGEKCAYVYTRSRTRSNNYS